MKIFKYPLAIKQEPQIIIMPLASSILTAQMQGDQLMLWALVDDKSNHFEKRSFVVVGTGQDVENYLTHIATTQDGSFVWHVFEWPKSRF